MTTSLPALGPAVGPLGSATLGDGTTVYATEYRTAARESGRRIVLRDNDGAVVWDSDECYDRANALDKMFNWLAANTGAERWDG